MGDLRRRIFARVMSLVSDPYERLVRRRKRRLLGGAGGIVVEIGPGTGPNLRFVADGARWVGVEPNPHMAPYLREEARARNLRIHIVQGTAGALPFPDASVDVVISTLVLCSVGPDLDSSLAEIRRVLRPGGRFIFLEHVAAPSGSMLRRVQRWVGPLWSRVADGCRLDRETGHLIEEAGFEQVEMERFRLKLPLVSPHVSGVARK